MTELISAELKLGFSCNNRCNFCLNADKKVLRDLTTEQIKKRILDLKAQGFNYLILTGGEPAIRDDIFEICSFAVDNGFSLEMHSNGRRFSDMQFAEQICSIGIDCFLISFHAHNSETYKEMCGVDGYAEVVEGIRNIKKHKGHVVTNTVLTKQNYLHLGDIVDMLKNLSVDKIQLLFPEGQGAMKADYMQKTASMSCVAAEINKLISKDPKTDFLVAHIPLCILGQDNRKYLGDFRQALSVETYGIQNSKFLHYLKKEKPFACIFCSENSECDGLDNLYLLSYGDSEINPLG